MTLLEVTPASLERLAGHCGSWAGEIAAATPSVPNGAGHASAEAVAAVHGRIGVSGVALAARMSATAEKLTNAAVGHASQDAQSAAVLSRVVPDV
jgi:hypothetical protein